MEMTAHLGGILRETLAVAFRVGITRFHAKAEAANHGFGRFQFVGELLQFQEGTDAGKESSSG